VLRAERDADADLLWPPDRCLRRHPAKPVTAMTTNRMDLRCSASPQLIISSRSIRLVNAPWFNQVEYLDISGLASVLVTVLEQSPKGSLFFAKRQFNYFVESHQLGVISCGYRIELFLC
jgi:hypothetical protein